MSIHKSRVRVPGMYNVPGTPRTISIDGDGHVAVYYETGTEEQFHVLFTGGEVPDGHKVISTVCQPSTSLVYHLAVKS